HWVLDTYSRSRAPASTARCGGRATGRGSSGARCRPPSRGSAGFARASSRCPMRGLWCSRRRDVRLGPCGSPTSATRGLPWTCSWGLTIDEDTLMANTTDVVSAIRELTNTKQLDRGELLDLLRDGLHAALVKRYGPNVRAEIGIDELKGTIKIVVLRTVVESVEDPGGQVSVEEARFEDPEF